MLKHRVITASVLLVLFLAALFGLPDAAWAILVTVVVAQGAVEWTRMAKFAGREAKLFWWVAVLCMLFLSWFDAYHASGQQLSLHLSVYSVSALLWFAVVPAWMMSGRRVENPWLMALTGWAVLVPTGLAMLDLRVEGPWLLLGMMCLVWVADIAAYFSGRSFGKHKLAPNISPGKTWEGVIGALVSVSIIVVAGWYFSPYSTGRFALFPALLIASWCWVALAVVGDLFESLIKRQAGLKDSGTLLPGHGGLLDRIDALTSTLPIAAFALLLQKVH